MNPLRLSLFALLLLAVLGLSQEAEASPELWGNPLAGNHNDDKHVDSVAISENGQYFASGTLKGDILFFSKSVEHTNHWELEFEYNIDALDIIIDISASGEYFVVSASDNNVYLFSKDSDIPLWSYFIGDSIMSGEIEI